MKKSRKFISLLLSMVMLFSITAGVDLSTYADTSGDFEYSVSGSNATITKYTGTATSVTIPLKIDGYTVTSIGYGPFSWNENLTSVIIPNSVTSIGSCAFRYCTSLASITIPNSVTSIGEYAFESCSSLTSVTIPNSVTSIGSDAFYRVNNIVYNGSASGSPWGAKSVNGYVDGYLIYKNSTKKELLGCSAQATSVTIPNSVTSIGDYAFYKCTDLTNVTIPNSVTSIMNDAFWNCTSLTSVTIPNSVTSIGSDAFYLVNNIVYNGSASGSPWGAKSVNGYVDGYLVYKDSTKKELLGCSAQAINVTIPDSVISIGSDAFRNCTSLTSVTIGDSVTSFGDYAFEYCTSLTSVTIPNSVTSIGGYAFEYCTSLTSITIPDSVISIGKSVFRKCTSLENIIVASGNTNYSSEDGVLFNKDKTTLIQYPICNERTEYIIPNSVTNIAVGSFEDVRNLTVVTIPNSVINIEVCAFINCISLSDVTIPNSITNINSSIFYCCKSLKNITIPNSVISIGWGAFYGCSSLTDVYYMGSQSEWNDIEIYSSNECLLNATIHYNSIPACDVHTPSKAVIKNIKNATCNSNGSYESIVNCSVCKRELSRKNNTIPKVSHNYKSTTVKATSSKNGSVVTKCTVCGSIKSNTTIYYPKTISLSATSYTYDGKVKTPSVAVKDSKGKTLKKNTDYTVSYASGRKYVGKYAVKITFKGNYSGTKTLYFTIVPKTTSISSLSTGSKKFTVKWKKQSTQTTGYQIQYSTSSKFTKSKTVTVSKNSTTSKTLTKLSGKKKYYVRVRTYKKVGSTNYYSSWSKAKYVTTKK